MSFDSTRDAPSGSSQRPTVRRSVPSAFGFVGRSRCSRSARHRHRAHREHRDVVGRRRGRRAARRRCGRTAPRARRPAVTASFSALEAGVDRRAALLDQPVRVQDERRAGLELGIGLAGTRRSASRRAAACGRPRGSAPRRPGRSTSGGRWPALASVIDAEVRRDDHVERASPSGPASRLCTRRSSFSTTCARRGAVERVGAQRVPQLPHQRGGADAVAHHVAHGEAEPAAVERDRVVPVAADVGARAAAACSGPPSSAPAPAGAARAAASAGASRRSPARAAYRRACSMASAARSATSWSSDSSSRAERAVAPADAHLRSRRSRVPRRSAARRAGRSRPCRRAAAPAARLGTLVRHLGLGRSAAIRPANVSPDGDLQLLVGRPRRARGRAHGQVLVALLEQQDRGRLDLRGCRRYAWRARAAGRPERGARARRR